MGNNIGYHTRLYLDNTKKVCGGSFGGEFDMNTVNRLVKAHFKVIIKPSGNGAFVDKEGREVTLYFMVDALKTEAGKEALKEDRKRREIEQQKEELKEREIRDIMDGMDTDEILKRLKD